MNAAAPALKPIDQWGPFVPDLDPGERVARLRCLRAVVHLCCGSRGETAERELSAAERDAGRAPAAAAAVYALEPVDRRRVLASYAALSRPAA